MTIVFSELRSKALPPDVPARLSRSRELAQFDL